MKKFTWHEDTNYIILSTNVERVLDKIDRGEGKNS